MNSYECTLRIFIFFILTRPKLTVQTVVDLCNLVNLRAACLPLINVVENQTVARSSVPTRQGTGNNAGHQMRIIRQHWLKETRQSFENTASLLLILNIINIIPSCMTPCWFYVVCDDSQCCWCFMVYAMKLILNPVCVLWCMVVMAKLHQLIIEHFRFLTFVFKKN